MSHIINIGFKTGVALAAVALLLAPALSVQAADLSEGYSSTFSPEYSSTYTPDSSTYTSEYSSTYSPEYSTTYTPEYSSTYTPEYSSTYTPEYSSTYTPEYSSTYTPEYSSTYTPSYGCSYSGCGGGGGGGGGGGCTHNCTPTPPAPVCTLVADRTNIQPGQDVRLTWTSQNATSGTLSSYGAISLNSWINLFPSHTTTYTATFTSQNGRSVTCTTTVTVTTPPPPVYNAPSCNIYINNYNQYNQYNTYGQPVTITWSSQNANYGYINQGIGSVNLSGSRTVYPNQSTVYTATFIGQNNQTVTCSVTVNINTYVPPPVYPPIYQNPVPYVTLSAVPYTGLDLGPVGTALYWGFLIAWCAFAAYLIAVKRVHMSLARWYKKALFGETVVHEVHTPAVAHGAAAMSQTELARLAEMLRAVVDGAPAKSDTVATVEETNGVDSFVLSQIHRGKRS